MKAIYAWYVVVVLIMASMVSFIDRQVITLMVEPIRSDLAIGDTEMSLLMGMAFAIFYVLMAVPIARLSDSYSRKRIIVVGIFLWSLATAACGLARTFTQLFLARVAVGVGEASLIPAAYSMIADYFPPERLGRAIGAFSTSIFLGAGAALIVGGGAIAVITEAGELVLPLFGEIRPWQMTFLVVSIPGIAVGSLMLLTVREPQRGSQSPGVQEGAVPVPEIVAFLRRNSRTLLSITFGYAAGGMAFYAFLFWTPEFLRRTYGMEIETAAIVFGTELAVLGAAGAISGGWFADFLFRRGYKDAALRAATIIFALCAVLMCVTPLMPDAATACILLGLVAFVMSLQQGLSPVAIQMITPNRMRAQVTALFLLIANFSAIGGGATSVALLTDYVFESDMALRYSLSTIGLVAMSLGSGFLLTGWRHYRESIDRATVRKVAISSGAESRGQA